MNVTLTTQFSIFLITYKLRELSSNLFLPVHDTHATILHHSLWLQTWMAFVPDRGRVKRNKTKHKQLKLKKRSCSRTKSWSFHRKIENNNIFHATQNKREQKKPYNKEERNQEWKWKWKRKLDFHSVWTKWMISFDLQLPTIPVELFSWLSWIERIWTIKKIRKLIYIFRVSQ